LNIIRKIGRRVSSITNGMICEWKTMSAARNIAISLQCAALNGPRQNMRGIMRTLFSIAVLTIAVASSTSFGQTPEKTGIPELASSTFGWQSVGADWLPAPPGLRGPIKTDPDHPLHSNTDGPGQVTLRMGDYK